MRTTCVISLATLSVACIALCPGLTHLLFAGYAGSFVQPLADIQRSSVDVLHVLMDWCTDFLSDLRSNWGFKWDEVYDDMMHIFPPTRNECNFLNFGYTKEKTHTCAKDVVAGSGPFNDTSSANLYTELASLSPVSLARAKVLEISSGRGGGLALLSDCYCPSETIGLDITASQVEHAKQSFQRDGECPIRFIHGDAMHLPFNDGSFDVIINVEASHTYPSYRKFAAEARRVLRPGGALLTTDLRGTSEADLDAKILESVFEKKVEPQFNLIDITQGVLKSLNENQKTEWALRHCTEKITAKRSEMKAHMIEDKAWDLSPRGMGSNPRSCHAIEIAKDLLATGRGVYRIYILKK